MLYFFIFTFHHKQKMQNRETEKPRNASTRSSFSCKELRAKRAKNDVSTYFWKNRIDSKQRVSLVTESRSKRSDLDSQMVSLCSPLIRTVSSLHFHNHFPGTNCPSEGERARGENRFPRFPRVRKLTTSFSSSSPSSIARKFIPSSRVNARTLGQRATRRDESEGCATPFDFGVIHGLPVHLLTCHSGRRLPGDLSRTRAQRETRRRIQPAFSFWREARVRRASSSPAARPSFVFQLPNRPRRWRRRWCPVPRSSLVRPLAVFLPGVSFSRWTMMIGCVISYMYNWLA